MSVDVTVNAPTGTIVLNRVECGNALDSATVDELRQALSDLHQDQRVRAVVVTGAGESFCAGDDLSQMAAEQADTSIDLVEKSRRWGDQADDLCDLVREWLTLPKPIIAAVNGPVGGLGVGLLMASDLVLACDTATMSVPDAQHGLVAGLVAPLVAYRAGVATAARLAVVGEVLDAAEAHRIGLYQQLVPYDLLWARGMQAAQQCAASAPQSINLTKRLLLETVGEKLLTDLTSGAIATATARTTDAANEGLAAFREDRRPEWAEPGE